MFWKDLPNFISLLIFSKRLSTPYFNDDDNGQCAIVIGPLDYRLSEPKKFNIIELRNFKATLAITQYIGSTAEDLYSQKTR